MKKTVLKKYAHLIAAVGANVQKGQEVFIDAALDQPEFVEMLVAECYRLGASRVEVTWTHQPLDKLDALYQSVDTLAELTVYQEARWKHCVERLPCRIFLESEDPDGLKGVDQDKLDRAKQRKYPLIKTYRDQIDNRHQWCIAAVPGADWAKKLFPALPRRQAVERLWEAILNASRATDDPVAAWEAHNRALKEHCAWLNSLGIERLHYTAANGTDFTIGMIPEGRFIGGRDTTLQGVSYNPNIPSEECFISPHKDTAEGVVMASMPLSWEGRLIDRFWIRFHEGKAVEWHADVNNEALTHIITMDEGSARLGECALVPYDSPIRKSGILFYSTLFDENAACHLALGEGFADTIEGYQERSLQECRALGVNDSIMHVDFMIGTADMNIDAITRDGKTVPVFRNGNWAK